MKRNCLSLRNSVPSIRHAPGTNYPPLEVVNLLRRCKTEFQERAKRDIGRRPQDDLLGYSKSL